MICQHIILWILEKNGRIISKIELRFPVYYDGQEGNEIRMPDKNTVEYCEDQTEEWDHRTAEL